MRAARTTIDGAGACVGTVIVVDVIRAFTAAAYALAVGAEEIVLVEEVDEAFRLRGELPGSLLMGEVKGLPIDGFDYGNSPAQLASEDLRGKRMIQRTSNGTRGMVRSEQAQTLLAGSFVCASATARRLAERNAKPSFVITGIYPGSDGDEDAALADFLELLVVDSTTDPEPFLQRVRSSNHGQRMAASEDPQLRADLALCAELDRFEFSMPARRRDGLLILSAEVPA